MQTTALQYNFQVGNTSYSSGATASLLLPSPAGANFTLTFGTVPANPAGADRAVLVDTDRGRGRRLLLSARRLSMRRRSA